MSTRPSSASQPGDRERLLAAIERISSRRIAVVGDLIADEFIYGRVARVSREAPVLILEYDKTSVVPGGAGNAANNVAALGARTRLVGMVGNDVAGARLLDALHPFVARQGIRRSRERATPTKTRILAGGVHSAKQQVVRIDRGTRARAGRAEREAFARSALKMAAGADAVLVSDYGAGLVTPRLVQAIVRHAGQSRRARRIPVLVDSRYDLARYRGVTGCTPNEPEVEALLGLTIDDDPRVLEHAGRELLARLRTEMVLVTRGSRGMALFENGERTRHIAIYGSDEIADVTGAGDTVIATMTAALAAGASPFDAARLANYAGGLVVMKRGTATVSREELAAAVAADPALNAPNADGDR
jgi:D-glycero-beta-D-manno-heptose-7-phosphate kinase